MSEKQYLKMADAFVHDSVEALEQHIYAGYMSKHACEYAAHAINSHDELVRQRDELLAALELAESTYRLNVIADGEPSSILDAMQKAINNVKSGHLPDAGKMVLGGCNVEPMTLDEAITHANKKSIGSSQCAAQHAQLAKWLTDYRAMLAAAPKLGGV